jgi:hypothetical protein
VYSTQTTFYSAELVETDDYGHFLYYAVTPNEFDFFY